MAMGHNSVAAIRQFQILPHGDKGISLGDQHLGQHSAGAFSCTLAQWIVNRLRLTQRDDNGISRHGVSLLWEVLAGSTAASIRRLQSIVVTQIPV
jgi:hypothetical protein